MFPPLIPAVPFFSYHFASLSADYSAMQEMCFHTPPPWTEIVAARTLLEDRINEAQNTPPR